MPNVAAAIKMAAVLVPRLKAPRSCFIPASSLVRTKKMPIKESSTPTAAINMGANTAFSCISAPAALCVAAVAKAEAPNAMVAKMEPA